MKKWTKVLSAFVVATVMSAGMAAAVGCDGCGGDDGDGHEHTYATDWTIEADGHWKESLCGHDRIGGPHEDEDKDYTCDVCDYLLDLGLEDEDPTIVDGKITNRAQLIAFRQLGEITEGNYTLEADINLARIPLAAPTVVLSGTATFNGNGHIIQNATYADADAKTGLLFKSIMGGSVSDVKFLNCVVTSSSESAGLLAGTVESSDGTNAEASKAVISKIEFNSCAVNSTGNYGGLVYGRNEKSAYIEISEITAKNGSSVTCAEYGGLVGGDNVASTDIKFSNLDLAGKLTSKGNGAFVAGRTRGGNITIENAVIKAELSVNDGNLGLFVGNNPVSKLTLKNILIVETNCNYICKTGKAPTETDYQNIASVGGITLLTKATDEVATVDGTNSVAYLKDTLGFDFTNTWTEEGAGYRLKSASTNVKSENAKLTGIKVSAANAKTRYKVGETYTSGGLVVMGTYSDGVQLVLAEGTDYTVDASGADFTTNGNYKITVKPVSEGVKTVNYEIVVAKQTGFKVYQDRMSHVYLVGATALDTANLSVKSTWSDGKEETLKANEYTIDGYDLSKAGPQTAKVHNGDFPAQDIVINVMNDIPVAVDGKVYVNVDKSVDVEGKIVKGVANFSEVGEAIKYLEYSNLSDSTTKVVYIGEGTYTEHIKTSLKNLTLIGKGSDKTVITYSNVQSTVDPLTDKSFGLKENATVIALGEGFQIHNLAIRNDFDYPNLGKTESGPQGTALMIGGDKSVISNCLLYGHQDTLYFNNGRAYVANSEIQGNIDFIFGEATGLAYFDKCTIKAINKATAENPEKNNGYVTAMKADASNKPDYGYIFNDCNFTDDGTLLKGSMSLGRPWGPAATVAYIDCEFSAAYSTLAYGAIGEDGKAVKPRWYDMSGNKPQDADFVEYGSKGEGAITESVLGGTVLTDATEAAKYNKTNIFAATNGKCTWGAAWDCDAALTALKAMDTATVAATDLILDNLDVDEEVGGIKVEVGATTAFEIPVGPWNATDKSVSIVIADNTIASYEMGKITGLKAGETTITISKEGFETVTLKLVVAAPTSVSTTYTYTHGGDNADVWATTADVDSNSAAPAPGTKIVEGKPLTLTASGTKATISMKGFTTGSGKANEWVKITLKAEDGTVVGTIMGTTPADKALGDFTFTNNGVVTASAEFATIEISYGGSEANKHFAITELTIIVE